MGIFKRLRALEATNVELLAEVRALNETVNQLEQQGEHMAESVDDLDSSLSIDIASLRREVAELRDVVGGDTEPEFKQDMAFRQGVANLLGYTIGAGTWTGDKG